MLTFEEFFQKKKINLVQFQVAEPALFAEFSKHYPLMGEKSFDHTKKYWFNILRRTYPLATEIRPHAVQAEAISQMAVQGVAVAAAQNLDAGIERPKFTEDNLLELVEANVPEQDVSLAKIEKTISEDKPEAELATENPGPTIEPTKPAFKPRFNSKIIKKPEAEAAPEPITENPEPATEPPAKPTFKPKFNMQNIKKDVVKTVSETETAIPEPAIENPKPETEIPEPVIEKAYKPRFQMKNITKPAAENPPPATE